MFRHGLIVSVYLGMYHKVDLLTRRFVTARCNDPTKHKLASLDASDASDLTLDYNSV